MFDMPFEVGVKLIEKAYEMENEKKAYSRWLAGYEKEMSFGEFKEKLRSGPKPKVQYSQKTEKEILADVKAILEMR